MTCGACETENAAGKKFCVQCGAPLALACASCGSPLAPGERFCGELDRLETLVAKIESIPRGLRSPHLGAQAARYRGHLTAIIGHGDPSPSWKSAAGTFREIGAMPWVAVTLVKHGEWLAARGRAEEASTALDEARTILERLKATPWLDRIERVLVPLSGTGAEAAS